MGTRPQPHDAAADPAYSPDFCPTALSTSVDRSSGLTPLYQARQDPRYQRQALIRDYQDRYQCNLVILIDQIVPDAITLFAEMLFDLDHSRDLHLMLNTPGGDGEVAVRLARMAQEACRRLVILVPDTAKSAGTVLALAAHELIMGPTSDLGPIDPQILLPDRGFVSAKDLIAAVEATITTVAERPTTLPIQAAMLAGIDSTVLQFARSALARTNDLAHQAITSNPDRSSTDIARLCDAVVQPLIELPHSHQAVVGAPEARQIGLPVTTPSSHDPHWRDIWQIWSHYFALSSPALISAYESARASHVRVHEH